MGKNNLSKKDYKNLGVIFLFIKSWF